MNCNRLADAVKSRRQKRLRDMTHRASGERRPAGRRGGMRCAVPPYAC